ncbi:uncharacterized protein DUF4294 [Dokdonia sp. Hel_I_63]|uniref:DUF4294 domain-containing protein n=1 Tax=unclassified Dokdonia TaxID=2615033 RepID=UPI00020A6A2F|nr:MULTISPECIES: DUF4294 domain-containing protein [unclassified Dokdonia]AEE20143.1 hypothetical protein Krodi_2161 [Dokdonia sp. 4H-3-7-5]TVZ23603.1 uncharacterized protein DUF4294 [Dokdonia sp. Hel_I_63]
MRIHNLLYIIVFIAGFAQAQETPVDSTEVAIEYYIIQGDTIPRSAIDLNEVIVFKRLKFDNKEDRRRYLILRRKTRKVFPYAKLAADRLVELNSRLDSIEGKRARKKYTKIIHKYLEGEFSAELKKLTRTEGQILIKLIHRQTGETAFELIKRLRSGWRAFWYNTTASAFDISLKREFDPVNEEEDFLIEDILQRSFQSRILETQPSALDFEFLELSDKWKEKGVE